ncbi:MAG TPA: DUF3426 domain-containing protein [Beijerinckiaceae bacterium]|nr:DUF3426 domain-containing protein [Beijerinckiaceae bacterium]
MLIVCPACASEYTIDPGLVRADGRTVRCSACRETWFVPPPEAPAAPARPSRPLRAQRAARKRRFPSGLAAAALIGAVCGGAVVGREAVVRALPETARLYAGIGLPVNLRGLALAGVASEVVVAGEDRILVVEGEIANPGRRALPVPLLELAVQDERGRPLYTWTSEAPQGTLAPAESTRFRVRLAAPPPEGRRVFVRFAPPRDGTAVAAGPR